MSALEIYLQKAAETKGTWHKVAIQILRDYMNITPENELIIAIGQIKKQEYIRLLWEAGLTTRLQQVAINQSKRIEQETKGVE